MSCGTTRRGAAIDRHTSVLALADAPPRQHPLPVDIGARFRLPLPLGEEISGLTELDVGGLTWRFCLWWELEPHVCQAFHHPTDAA
jgi:hypothetical protein